MKKIILSGALALLVTGCAQETHIKGVDGTTYREIEKCDTRDNPMYGRTNTSDLVVGGLVGGAIGKKLTDKKSGAVVGGALGMLMASEHKYIYYNCRKELRKVK